MWIGPLISVAGLLAVGVILVVAWMRLRLLERQSRELKALVEQRGQQLREVEDELKQLSLTDPLTKLRNRRFLREMIDVEIARVHRIHGDLLRDSGSVDREKASLGFALLDIDDLKQVNDSFGHDVGDALIQHVAVQLQEAVRDVDAVIRWGGEEFLVVCKEVGRKSLHDLCLRLALHIKTNPLELSGGEVMVSRTCCVGFALYPFVSSIIDLFNYEEVINFADNALQIAKSNGRDLVVGIVGEEGAIGATDKDRLKQDLAQGMEQGQLQLIAPEGVELELKA
jgi:diguanylate cyclase (GGDEF)-like protein